MAYVVRGFGFSAAGASLVFFSDWSTATGNTQNATRDGTKWDFANNIASPSANRVAVISSSGLSFPAIMSNVLAITYEQTHSVSCGVQKDLGWSLPSVGGVIAFRCYVRNAIQRTNSATHHPLQSQSAGSAGNCLNADSWRMTCGATYNFQIGSFGSGFCDPADPSFTVACHTWTVSLARDTTYRIEERWYRTGTNSWTLQARVYDSSDVLILGNSDFVCSGQGHASHTLAAGDTIDIADSACLRYKQIVNTNDDIGVDGPTENRIFYGGFAVSLTDWCGAYTASG